MQELENMKQVYDTFVKRAQEFIDGQKKKMTFQDLIDTFRIYNENHNITSQFDENALYGIIVYKQSNFTEPYTEEQRSYRVSSANKYVMPHMYGNSLFGDCIDGTDNGVRLDCYDWEVEYCYLDE